MQYHLLNLFVSIFNSVFWPLNINAMQFPETPSMKMREIERECYFHFCEMKLKQDLETCAELCDKNDKLHGQRRLRCCTFEWSKSEQRCELHENCLTSYELRRKKFFTCRKKGVFLIKFSFASAVFTIDIINQ